MTMKYMKILMATTMCCLVTISMTACGDDTMNSATYGEEEDDVMDNIYEDGDTLMDDFDKGVGDVIHGTEDVLEDAGDDIRDGLEDGWDDLMDGDLMGDGIYDDGDMNTLDTDLEDRN